MKQMHAYAVVVAGGSGKRMKSDQKKQYLDLGGIPVITRTLGVFDAHPGIRGIVLVVPGPDLETFRGQYIQPYGIQKEIHLTAGGETRQDSVSNGLACVKERAGDFTRTLVLIHDGVRPFISVRLMDRLMETAMEKGGCIPVLGLTDTVKEISGNRVTRTVDRESLFRVQTPQVFRLDLILSAFQHAEKSGFSGTDDASVLEHAGQPVYTTEGSKYNIKLTTPEDLVLAGYILKKIS